MVVTVDEKGIDDFEIEKIVNSSSFVVDFWNQV